MSLDNTAALMFATPGSVVEIRTLSPYVVSGYFDNSPEFIAAARELDSGAFTGVYCTLNAVKPELLARSPNRLTHYAKTATSDDDIAHRHFLFIDTDTRRKPSKSNATDEEFALAIEMSERIAIYLDQLGWPQPAHGPSGNGGHLLYAIDLPAADGGLIERVLSALSFLFSTERVNVDTSNGNAARLTKLYGTTARKAPVTIERPHRMSAITLPTDGMRIVTRELLERVAQSAPQPEVKKTKTRGNVFDVDGFLQRASIDIASTAPWQGGQKWRLARCPFSDEHEDGAFVVQFPSGAIAAGCHHNSCERKSWNDLRSKVDPNWTAASSTPAKRSRIVVLSDVATRNVEWLWPNNIALGKLTVIAGRGGGGKSTLACEIAACVTRGAPFPDGTRPPIGDVLWLPFEDEPGDTLRPRLEAAGADLCRVHVHEDVETHLCSLKLPRTRKSCGALCVTGRTCA